LPLSRARQQRGRSERQTGRMTDLLTVSDLEVSFLLHQARIDAVRGVSFRIPQGKTVALVGESGSGKAVVSQSILCILPRSARLTNGSIVFADPATGAADPVDIVRLPAESEAMRRIRGGRISIIFQEPMTSLSPLHTVGDQVSEALLLHRDVG